MTIDARITMPGVRMATSAVGPHHPEGLAHRSVRIMGCDGSSEVGNGEVEVRQVMGSDPQG